MQQVAANTAMTLPPQQQQQIAQPQFLIQQPAFGGGQYATFPQFAYTNQQGQIVLQPAGHFTALQGSPGQAAGQPQVILTGALPQQQQQQQPQPQQQQPQQQHQAHHQQQQQHPQTNKQPGVSHAQQQMMNPGQVPKNGGSVANAMPANYTITSTGQLQQICAPPNSGPPQTYMIASSMIGPTGIPGAVSMAGHTGQTQTIQTTMTAPAMQIKDGKPQPGQQNLAAAQPQAAMMQQQQQMSVAGHPNQQMQQFVIPSNGMTYMQAGPAPNQYLQQNGQIILRAPGQPDQVMFAPTQAPNVSQMQQPQQAQVSLQQAATLVAPPSGPNMQHQQQQQQQQHQQAMQPMAGGMVRPPASMIPPQSGPPPGKTAISRAIAPLLPNSVTQTAARMGYGQNGTNQNNQSSPKSKQKVSPRGSNGGVNRPSGPKGGAMKVMPRPPAGSPGPLPVQPQAILPAGMPRSQVPTSSVPPALSSVANGASGPPTLTPMMAPTSEMSAMLVGAPPISSAPMMMSCEPMNSLSSVLPTSQVMPVQQQQPHQVQTSIPSTVMSNHLSKLMPVSASVASSYSSSVTSKPPPGVVPPTSQILDMPPTLTKEINTNAPAVSAPDLAAPAIAAGHMSQNGVAAEKFGENDAGALGNPTPKAVVKPQVLTHVIDGHVIKESSQPFPVSPVKGKSSLYY